ncbi:unnamed protein product [Prorocentrum cordatum]|uniref:Uncharacterized protein n=1 Tax=Prorocentrum cordatum TaxID=2364126 RepID=A0ABN9W754_9DINO|nr:unnamed protein product [Polarella glacialis]
MCGLVALARVRPHPRCMRSASSPRSGLGSRRSRMSDGFIVAARLPDCGTVVQMFGPVVCGMIRPLCRSGVSCRVSGASARAVGEVQLERVLERSCSAWLPLRGEWCLLTVGILLIPTCPCSDWLLPRERAPLGRAVLPSAPQALSSNDGLPQRCRPRARRSAPAPPPRAGRRARQGLLPGRARAWHRRGDMCRALARREGSRSWRGWRPLPALWIKHRGPCASAPAGCRRPSRWAGCLCWLRGPAVGQVYASCGPGASAPERSGDAHGGGAPPASRALAPPLGLASSLLVRFDAVSVGSHAVRLRTRIRAFGGSTEALLACRPPPRRLAPAWLPIPADPIHSITDPTYRFDVWLSCLARPGATLLHGWPRAQREQRRGRVPHEAGRSGAIGRREGATRRGGWGKLGALASYLPSYPSLPSLTMTPPPSLHLLVRAAMRGRPPTQVD